MKTAAICVKIPQNASVIQEGKMPGAMPKSIVANATAPPATMLNADMTRPSCALRFQC